VGVDSVKIDCRLSSTHLQFTLFYPCHGETTLEVGGVASNGVDRDRTKTRRTLCSKFFSWARKDFRSMSLSFVPFQWTASVKCLSWQHIIGARPTTRNSNAVDTAAISLVHVLSLVLLGPLTSLATLRYFVLGVDCE
jgi:hypothetical protein